jgi:hypothetical protein
MFLRVAPRACVRRHPTTARVIGSESRDDRGRVDRQDRLEHDQAALVPAGGAMLATAYAG